MQERRHGDLPNLWVVLPVLGARAWSRWVLGDGADGGHRR